MNSTLETGSIVFISVRLVWLLLSVFGNTLVIIAVWRFTELRTTTNYLIVNLAISDGLQGFLGLPLLVLTELSETVQQWKLHCMVTIIILLITSGGNNFSICAIAIERFIYIHYPLRYHLIVTPKRLNTGIVVSWVYISVLMILSVWLGNAIDIKDNSQSVHLCDTRFIILSDVYTFVILGHLFMFIIVTIILYAYIAYTALKANSRTHSITASVACVRDTSSVQIKVTKMLALVLGIYLAVYLPSVILGPFISEGDHGSWKEIVRYLFLLLFYINTWINPCIYAWKANDFRKAFIKLLHLKVQSAIPLHGGVPIPSTS